MFVSSWNLHIETLGSNVTILGGMTYEEEMKVKWGYKNRALI